jgi:cysteinyl-tRNA synthetase
MALELYDTLTRKKRPFVPIDPANVRMYVCGPTVYDFAHIGNARPVIVFDVLFRLLRHLYGPEHVTYVRNITDVDDKINARAAERYPKLPLNEAISKITKRTLGQFHSDVKALRCRPPTVEPRATDHIREMKLLIERLIANGCAYVAKEHVLFDVKKISDYGQFSQQSLDQMIEGARVEVAPIKNDPLDFVLWKPSKEREPAWPSPAGIATPGRPGWHIECSAMAWKHLGETFDIHGGGIDLVFPHHENEIAQSRCAFHTPVMANYWMHNGFLQVEGTKMAKSLGNFITIRELLQTTKFGGRSWGGETLRFAMLQTHYRQPIDWTVRALEQSISRLSKWKHFASERVTATTNRDFYDEVVGHLCDDLNTPAAFTAIDRAVNATNVDHRDHYTVNRLLQLLGFMRPHSKVFLLAKDLSAATSRLATLSLQDWNNLVVSISQRPKLSTGEPRPGSNAIAAISALNKATQQLLPIITPAMQSMTVQEIEQGILARLSLTRDEFETRVAALISERNAARKAKDFAESDRIRDELAAMGVVLKDTKDGTTWEIAR